MSKNFKIILIGLIAIGAISTLFAVVNVDETFVISYVFADIGHIQATEDGMIIHGGTSLHGAVINSNLDHRIAMSFAIAGMNADGATEIQGAECVNISYPNFYSDLEQLIR